MLMVLDHLLNIRKASLSDDSQTERIGKERLSVFTIIDGKEAKSPVVPTRRNRMDTLTAN